MTQYRTGVFHLVENRLYDSFRHQVDESLRHALEDEIRQMGWRPFGFPNRVWHKLWDGIEFFGEEIIEMTETYDNS